MSVYPNECLSLSGEETASLVYRDGSTLGSRTITLKELREKWDAFDVYTTIQFPSNRRDCAVWLDENQRLCVGTANNYTWYYSIDFQTKIEMIFAADNLISSGKTIAEIIDYLDEM